MMFHHPAAFFSLCVEPNWEDFIKLKNQVDGSGGSLVRFAMNTSITAYHLYEHMFAFYSDFHSERINNLKKSEAYRDYLIDRTPEFGQLRDIADCCKHYSLSRKAKTVSVAENIHQRLSIEVIATREDVENAKTCVETGHKIIYPSQTGKQERDVVIKEMEEIQLSKVLAEVISMWKEIFQDVNIWEELKQKEEDQNNLWITT